MRLSLMIPATTTVLFVIKSNWTTVTGWFTLGGPFYTQFPYCVCVLLKTSMDVSWIPSVHETLYENG